MNLNNIVGSFGRVPLPFWRAVLPCAFAVLGIELPHVRTVFGALESHFTLRKPIYLPHPRRLLPCALLLDSGRSAQLFSIVLEYFLKIWSIFRLIFRLIFRCFFKWFFLMVFAVCLVAVFC